MQSKADTKPGAERRALAAQKWSAQLHAAILSGDMDRVADAQRSLSALGFGAPAAANQPDSTAQETNAN